MIVQLTNLVNNQRHKYYPLTIQCHFDSEDDSRSGCRNFSHCHQQFFSELHRTNRTTPDDHTRQTTDTPGFKPFTIILRVLFDNSVTHISILRYINRKGIFGFSINPHSTEIWNTLSSRFTRYDFCLRLSPCMGISDEIDDATIAIDKTANLEIKATI